MKTIIISLGGSLIIPEDIDVSFLKKFKEAIIEFVSEGNRAVIVTGGGQVCRKYIRAAEKLSEVSDISKDFIGIRATKLNAELILSMFGNDAHNEVIEDPTTEIETGQRIIIASGWKPGFSSDMDAVLLAENLNAGIIINMSNIDYVYDKDPKKFKNAKPIKRLSWEDMGKLVGEEWVPGMNLPFDPVASKKAAELRLKVMIIGKDVKNLKNLLKEKEFKGTLII